MAYMVIGPDTEGNNFGFINDYMVVDEDAWAAYVSGKKDNLDFAGPFTTEAEAKEARDKLNSGKAEFTPYPNEDDDEDEFISDPGDFDGGYGEGSYYEHAMRKDD